MLIGGHVSVAGGLDKAVDRAEAIGANVMQIFVTSPRSFRTTDYSDEQIAAFKKLYGEKKMKALFFHAVYLINLASEKESSVQLSIDSLVHYLNMGDKLGAVGTVVHLGSYGTTKKKKDVIASRQQPEKQSQTIKNAIAASSSTPRNDNVDKFDRMIVAIKTILEKTPNSQRFIVENCAGSKIGINLDELVEIYKQVGSDRVGFCIDTQHLFASGVDVRDTKVFGAWLNMFDEKIGIENLTLIHANDSKTELASGADRHENIGDGQIGSAGFKSIIAQPLLKNKPFILEVPGEEQKGPDKENIEKLHSLIKN